RGRRRSAATRSRRSSDRALRAGASPSGPRRSSGRGRSCTRIPAASAPCARADSFDCHRRFVRAHSLENDSRCDRDPADDLPAAESLTEEQERKEDREERLERREERCARRPDPIDRREPQNVREEERADDRETEREPYLPVEAEVL